MFVLIKPVFVTLENKGKSSEHPSKRIKNHERTIFARTELHFSGRAAILWSPLTRFFYLTFDCFIVRPSRCWFCEIEINLNHTNKTQEIIKFQKKKREKKENFFNILQPFIDFY